MTFPQELKAQLPCQCTRSCCGDGPRVQRFCYCLTCGLTPDTNKCICEPCAYACHFEHEYCYGGTGPVLCCCEKCQCQEPVNDVPFDDDAAPCLPPNQPYRCTLNFTKENFYLQHNYKCLTCKQKDGEGVCAVCARVCHAGHRLQDNGITPFYCDCGMGAIDGVKCRCLGENVPDENVCLPFVIPFRCTATFEQGKTRFQRCFQCQTCGTTDENPICEVCAQKCHPNHKLVDLKIRNITCKCQNCQCRDETEELFVPSLCAEEGVNAYNCGCDSDDVEEEEEECDCGHHHHHHH